MDTLFNLLARAGLLLCAVGLALMAIRLHRKAKGKRKGAKKTGAVILMMLAGLALVGTVFGDWMIGGFGTAGGLAAAALVLFTVGPVLIDWIADGEPDRVALYCSALVPLALVVGFAQLWVLGDELNKQGHRISDTVTSTTDHGAHHTTKPRPGR